MPKMTASMIWAESYLLLRESIKARALGAFELSGRLKLDAGMKMEEAALAEIEEKKLQKEQEEILEQMISKYGAMKYAKDNS